MYISADVLFTRDITDFTCNTTDLAGACRRPTIIVNLDPANDALPYHCDVNIFDLVSLEDVAEAYNLGPNGGAYTTITSIDLSGLPRLEC